MAHPIHEARAKKADLDVEINALKSEGFKLVGQPNSATRVTEITTSIAAKQAELSEVLTDLARLEKEKAEDIAYAAATSDRARGEECAPSAGAAVQHGGGGVKAGGHKFSDLFPNVPRDLGGFRDANDFLGAIHSGLADPRLANGFGQPMRAGMTTTVPSEGGFAVPSQLAGQWLDSSLPNEIIRPRATVLPMSGTDLKAVGFDDADRSSTIFGGFSGAWSPEDTAIAPELPKLRTINLHARKLAILTRVSNELLADAMDFERQISSAIVRACGYFLDLEFLQGLGTRGPMGIVNAPCTIVVPKIGAQSSPSIIYENLTSMYARLTPGSHEHAVWICNQTAMPQLLTLNVLVGVAGSFVPALTESNGQFRILGIPVLFTPLLPALGSQGDILLCDLRRYTIGLRSDVSIAKSGHAGFADDVTYFRATLRLDGMPQLASPITPRNGDSVSPFVTLAARP